MFLKSAIATFHQYKILGERAIAQMREGSLSWQLTPETNSVAVIVRHLHGNMLSRWTDFLTTDGEKEDRNRDAEFEESIVSRDAVMQAWAEGWACLFDALERLTEEDLNKTIYIRGEAHSVTEAIHWQMAHYAYHVGQIVLLARAAAGTEWTFLSIPKGESEQFNARMAAARR